MVLIGSDGHGQGGWQELEGPVWLFLSFYSYDMATESLLFSPEPSLWLVQQALFSGTKGQVPLKLGGQYLALLPSMQKGNGVCPLWALPRGIPTAEQLQCTENGTGDIINMFF